MSTATKHIRHGVGSVRPYLYGRLDMLELVKRAFGAVELERLEAGNGYHVEAKIGDSMVVMEVGDPPHPGASPPPSMCTSTTSTPPTSAHWPPAQRRSQRRRTSPTRSAPPA
jgi:hypothetical protein